MSFKGYLLYKCMRLDLIADRPQPVHTLQYRPYPYSPFGRVNKNRWILIDHRTDAAP